MSTNWTTDQEKAINIRNCNTLVSAAAGSGKTAVLVERVINMVTDEENPVYIDRLLIATFTNAAAAEMKERIYQSLQKKIAENPHSSYLRKQLVLLGQAQISTIHSLCTNLIRDNFHLLGIRYDFDIADEANLSNMRKLAIERVFEKAYDEQSSDFKNTVDAFGGKKNDDNLAEIVLSVYKYAESLANPEKWLLGCVANLKSRDFLEKIKNEMYESFSSIVSNVAFKYKQALDAIENDPGLTPYYDIFLKEYDILRNFESEKFKTKISEIHIDNLPQRRRNADPETAEFVRGIRNEAKNSISKISKYLLYTDEEILDENEKMFPFVKTLCNLVLDFKKTYEEIKSAENVLDFNDLEHFAIRLLEENDDLRNHLKEFYKEILVDEYQDTNGVQAYLFDLLSSGNNLFMVGDVKQSIYGFRNSNPKYFIEKYNRFEFENSEYGTKINLSKNFRSSNDIISNVNFFFEKLMIAELGGVTYNNEHALVYGNDKIKNFDASVERYVINTKKADNTDVEESDVDKVNTEAIFVANRIHRLVEIEKPEIFDKITNSYRSITYKDIVVLMRKTKKIASVYAEVFAERGIPVYTAESGGYFNCTEVATVMSFLKVIENPLQDIPLLAIMRSPVFGFDDNYIALLRSENKNDNLYSVLKKSDDKKITEFVCEIEKIREYSKYNNVGAVVRKIVFDTGYYQFVGGLPNGNMRMMNLNLLCERANDFSQRGYKSVSEFISYVKSMIESDNEYSAPKLISENDNVVNIMSIHKSKGLEYPVVFLCETGLAFNKMDFSKPYIFDEEYGLAMNIVDMNRHFKYVPFIKKAICEKKTNEMIAEEIRLLYVALTRAKYKLIISGTAASDKSDSADFNMSAYDIKLKKNYLDMLLMKVKGLPDAQVYTVSQILENDIQIVEQNDGGHKIKDYSEFYDDISSRLEFKYKHPESKYIPSKKSISEIAALGDEINLSSVSTSSEEISSAQKGTLVHFVLQNINLSNVNDLSAVEEQIDGMVKNGIFEREYVPFIDINALYNFFISDIGKRMLNSDKVYREYKFCVDVPAKDLGYESDSDSVLIQGVIDCCFIEDGEFVIIDYKTGSLKEKYKIQIELYKRCLEISTGKKVKETHIYPLI